MLRRSTAEDKNFALPLDDFTVATNWLYRRSDLHNSISQYALYELMLYFLSAIPTPVIHDSDPVA